MILGSIQIVLRNMYHPRIIYIRLIDKTLNQSLLFGKNEKDFETDDIFDEQTQKRISDGSIRVGLTF